MRTSKIIATLFLATLYILILGHNILPHTHHSQEAHHHHDHHESSLLDNLLGHHEHSSDFGDDLVDIFYLSDNDYILQAADQIIQPAYLTAYYTYYNIPTSIPTLLEKPIGFQEYSIPIESEDTHAHSRRGPPLV
ncbi:MAG: hypothetical protein GY810_22875 [Aureispira sp.]|nr:hypothetical protein [Aureispira sp.]